MIFVPTLPQSGTWFVLRLLEKCGYSLEFTGDVVLNKKIIEDKSKVALSTHIFPFYYQASPFKEVIPHYGTHATTDYVVKQYHMGMAGIELLTRLHKTIIPIRDPLACILTREARAPQLRHFYIIDGFLEVIKRYEDNPNVFFFPVDRYNTVEDRGYLVKHVLNCCDIDINKYRDEIDNYIVDWKKVNSAENRFREPYENGDIDKIKDMLKEKWAEVEYLKIHGGTIWPFLNRLGYTDKLW